jgi:nondiscriminating aspartyl-tRNA synthetase
MRVLSNDVKQQIGQVVHIEGWLHKKRLLGGLTFINVRDRHGLVQVVIQDKDEVEKLRGLQVGTVLAIDGTAVEEPRAPGGAELHDAKLTVLVPVTDEPPIEIDKPLSHKPDNLDTLFDYRVIGLRNLQERAIFEIQATICAALREYFAKNSFTEIRTPKLLAEPTEGGAEVFKLDYFGKTATLAQSPQFYKQMMVGPFERVYEIAPVYRAEPSATTRHMTEYTSVDGEMGFIVLKDLEEFLSGLLSAVVVAVWEKHEPELKRWNATRPTLPETIPVLTMQEIHERYSQANNENTVGEKDLRPDEERWICDYAKKNLGSEAVFVSEWPASEMKFYHQANEADPQLADRIDLLFRGVEITTGSMREHRYETLVKQLKTLAGGDPKDPGFSPLLKAMQYGMPPHGGFGLGLERLTQKIIGLNNVKEATLFPRDINRLTP